MGSSLFWIFMIFEISKSCSGVAPDSTDYCRKKFQCEGSRHLRCEFKMATDFEFCRRIEVVMTPELRGVLLQWMNLYRENVASGKTRVHNGTASNMRRLYWDHKYEEFAMLVGSHCGDPDKFKAALTHSCTGTEEVEEGAGAILYSTSHYNYLTNFLKDLSNLTIPDDVIDAFAYPAKKTGGPKPKTTWPFDPEGYPSHTAVLWARSHRIGCTVITCHCQPSAIPTTHLICFVGPEPNLYGLRVFKRNAPCGDCARGTKCSPESTYPKLCSRPNSPDADLVDDIHFSPESVRRLTFQNPDQNRVSACSAIGRAHFLVPIPLLILTTT